MPSSAAIVCRQPQEHVASISYVPAQVGGGVTSPQTIKDIAFSVTTNTVGTLSYDTTQVVPQFRPNWTLTSDTPSICTVSGNRVTKVSNGQGVIRASGPHGFAKLITLDFSSTVTVSNIWTGFTGVTASSKLSSPILALLIPGKQKNYYAPNYVLGDSTISKNPNCWAASLDITGSAVSTTLGGSANSGALITPQHWVGVAHWGEGSNNMGPGAVMRFAGSDGTIHTRTVSRRKYESSKDRITCLLNAPLPATVKPFKLAGATMLDVANSRFLGMGWQVTQEKNIAPIGFDDFIPAFQSATSLNWVKWISEFPNITETNHRLFGLSSLLQNGRSGDSGGAIGGYYNGETFLVSLFSSSNAGPLFSYAQAAELNANIAELDAQQSISTGYTVSVINIT